MSGHSKWSTIKRKKEKTDTVRGKIFSKIGKEISIAAKIGGGDSEANPRLRTAVLAAKGVNMPATNIEKAIKKGTGELPGVNYEETTYEGYGPGGVAVFLEITTDNKNRTVAEIRYLFTRYGGNLGETGSVSWMFEKKGVIYSEKKTIKSEDQLLTVVLEAGALDMVLEGNNYEITTPPQGFERVKQALEKNQIPYSQAELTFLPKSQVKLEGREAEQMLKLMDALEEHDDVQKVYANFDIAEEIMEKMGVS
ncbi:MAG: transcriptional regulator [candidate division Zixibacteria bacterium RBG_16_48_11]|nr:MAG: transcriptional regulator [candidate division Zixibacteria bacterium RBG_16_48_11]